MPKTAENKTNNSEGSQSLLSVKNPIILLLLSIPEKTKPVENILPTKKLKKRSVIKTLLLGTPLQVEKRSAKNDNAETPVYLN